MRFRVLVLLFMVWPLLGVARADDRIYFHVECSAGQQCIDLDYYHNAGKTEAVVAIPAQVLGRADVESARIQKGVNERQSLSIELSRDASNKFEEITRENIGKRIMVVFDGKILTAPTINQPITGRNLTLHTVSGEAFWQKIPWLQDLINESHAAGNRSIIIYVIVALAACLSAFAFVVLPRMKRTRHSVPE